MRQLFTVALMSVCGCDPTLFATQAGEHVVYHWDVAAWAAENEHLCGGTAAAADQLVEAISSHYGWPVPTEGPSIEYFWDRELAKNYCAGNTTPACAGNKIVFSQDPFHTHELAHMVHGGQGGIPFIEEGFASRWQAGMVDLSFTFRTSARFFGEAELRAQLELGSSRTQEIDYQRAMTWFVALENAYGPARMRVFLDQLNGWSSTKDIERALQHAFGISLAESVTLAESLPEGVVDDPVCEFSNLPTWVWSDSIYIDRGDADCGDDDLVSVFSQRAAWLFAIEFPHPITVDVDVTLPEDVELGRQEMTLASCNGEFEPDWMTFVFYGAGYGSKPATLHGRHVGALIGEVALDGTVHLPRVSFQEHAEQ
jgi:hypothetical protein